MIYRVQLANKLVRWFLVYPGIVFVWLVNAFSLGEFVLETCLVYLGIVFVWFVNAFPPGEFVLETCLALKSSPAMNLTMKEICELV